MNCKKNEKNDKDYLTYLSTLAGIIWDSGADSIVDCHVFVVFWHTQPISKNHSSNILPLKSTWIGAKNWQICWTMSFTNVLPFDLIENFPLLRWYWNWFLWKQLEDLKFLWALAPHALHSMMKNLCFLATELCSYQRLLISSSFYKTKTIRIKTSFFDNILLWNCKQKNLSYIWNPRWIFSDLLSSSVVIFIHRIYFYSSALIFKYKTLMWRVHKILRPTRYVAWDKQKCFDCQTSTLCSHRSHKRHCKPVIWAASWISMFHLFHPSEGAHIVTAKWRFFVCFIDRWKILWVLFVDLLFFVIR